MVSRFFLQSLTAPPNNGCSNPKKGKHRWRTHMPGGTPCHVSADPPISTSFTNNSSVPHCQYMHAYCGPGGGMRLSRAGRMHTCLGHNTHGPSVLHSTAADVVAGTPQLRCGTTPPSPHKLNLGQEDTTGPSIQNLPECLPARVAKEVSYILGQPSQTPRSYRSRQSGESPYRHLLGPCCPFLCRGD